MVTAIRSDPGASATRAGGRPAERRKHPRRQISGVLGSRRSEGDHTVLDMSLTGLSAEVVGEVKPGEHYVLELVHQHRRVHVEAEVRWASVTRVERDRDRDRFVPVFRTGLSFLDVDRDESGGIWDWILPATESRR